jgi:hypothetical protein
MSQLGISTACDMMTKKIIVIVGNGHGKVSDRAASREESSACHRLRTKCDAQKMKQIRADPAVCEKLFPLPTKGSIQ